MKVPELRFRVFMHKKADWYEKQGMPGLCAETKEILDEFNRLFSNKPKSKKK